MFVSLDFACWLLCFVDFVCMACVLVFFDVLLVVYGFCFSGFVCCLFLFAYLCTGLCCLVFLLVLLVCCAWCLVV